MLLRNAAFVEGFMAFGREAVGVEGDERVFRPVFLQTVVKGDEPCEVGSVCD